MPAREPNGLDPELRELLPLFVEEARDRLERLATNASRLPGDEAARAEVQRELHTVKGAARMLQLGPIAELAHAAEELVLAAPAGLPAILTRVVDRLSTMVDAVAAGGMPEADAELLGEVSARAGQDHDLKRPGSASAGGG
ncbi:MAG TPA: Hpt domain-containing protein, partial [Thermoanaerobaculia bacterium]|nr:Hpt domain-containing protein [Thermoanaerobaculia bacterium]